MNREIKFRIWLGDKFKVIPLELVGRCSHSPCMNYNYDTFGVFEHVQSENRIYQQCTGLKDKNGKEIYDGDIISYYSPASEETFRNTCRGKVVWYDNFCWAFQYGEVNDVWFLNSDFDFKKCEIIGNIFENLKLLK